MKVLFAVSNEEISEMVVKKYQKQYKEIISYKNVYYFNAILKELQKDKTYDRIIISEDLETFTHTQYDQIDKFIFEKLDNITDEATNMQGEDIPIILICSERRTKSEQMLLKIFGIGIYNALIGNDRSIDNVCELVYKPRSKREAKTYYKIDTGDVKYEGEKENDVDEIEVQNILAHYKRIGNDEQKIIRSFDDIAEQYNDVQLKIICKVLPLNVKAVLEEKSAKYQKLMAFNKSVSDNLKEVKTKKIDQGTTAKLLKPKTVQNIMSKPVVIPSSVNMNSNMKLSKPKEIEVEKLEEVSVNNEVDNQKTIEPVVENTEKIDNTQTATPKRRRGRPPKKVEVSENTNVVTEPKRKRGRPPKKAVQQVEDENVLLPGFDEQLPEENNILPGWDNEDTKEEAVVNNNQDMDTSLNIAETKSNIDEFNVLPGINEEEENTDEEILPGWDEDTNSNVSNNESLNLNKSVVNNQNTEMNNVMNNYNYNNLSSSNYEEISDDIPYENIDISGLLTQDKKVACFVGTSKNGTSFIVNNVAQILSSMGVNTAILDTTKNRNSYYIYTKNEERLRNIATDTLENLVNGQATGIQANKNLTVYTSLPENNDYLKHAGKILQTIIQKHSVVLIDCDFKTPQEYFAQAQEIYLIQSLDVLTIQPLTAFLRELKAKNILEESKIKIVINKAVKVRGINEKAIIGGMAFYNDPSMSYMTELFDRNIVKYIVIPFDEEVYARYLGSLIDCEISLKGYPKQIRQSLEELSNMIYLKENSKSTYTPPTVKSASNPRFSDSMNSTLNQMRKY